MLPFVVQVVGMDLHFVQEAPENLLPHFVLWSIRYIQRLDVVQVVDKFLGHASGIRFRYQGQLPLLEKLQLFITILKHLRGLK